MKIEEVYMYLHQDSLKVLNSKGAYCSVSSYKEGVFDSEIKIPVTNDFVPVLRPLSDMVKEIIVDGKKFIPARVLFSIITGLYVEGYSIEDFNLRYRDTESPLSHEENFVASIELDGDLIEWESSMFPNWFTKFQDEPEYTRRGVDVTVKYWELLAKWRFDFNGLIEKRRAVDVNKIWTEDHKFNKALFDNLHFDL